MCFHQKNHLTFFQKFSTHIYFPTLMTLVGRQEGKTNALTHFSEHCRSTWERQLNLTEGGLFFRPGPVKGKYL